jgi:glycosyltransferase involved in cell wall biosynthesis
VVIPCYNAGSDLEAAVASVLSQTYRDFHLVLVDDASTDGTRALARRLAGGQPNISVVELPENRGRCFARNRGTEAASGPYVAFLDQDDTYHPEFLQVTVWALSQSPDLDAVKVLPHITVDIDPVRYNAVAESLVTTSLIRRSAFEFLGGWPEGKVFREHPGGCEDIAFRQLFASCFNLGCVGTKLYHYTHRPGNALDQFLRRSAVIDGKVVYPEAQEGDAQVKAEVRRLEELLRQRVRRVILERLGGRDGSARRGPGPRFARLEATEDWLTVKAASLKCQVCGKSDWHAGKVYEMAGQDRDAGPAGGEPPDRAVSLRCEGCGQLLLFDANATGVFP